jgi:tRNA pseudouridine55 synthase
MDGLLIIDKPIGPTSHDVVARVRRALREPRIGHTGTLDPMASGVLSLVIGRATRLARFLDQDRKSYDALVRLGLRTDSYDAHGEPVGTSYNGPWPSREVVHQALERFRGTFLQQPPAFSAKKIDGRRSYELARARRAPSLPAPPAPPALPAPVNVTADTIEVVNIEADLVALRIVCSSGFYVRALAHDLGEALGIGAHLAALRRTEANGATLADALPLAVVEDPERGRAAAMASLVPLPDMLPGLTRLTLTEEGARRVTHGGAIAPSHVAAGWAALPVAGEGPRMLIRLVTPAGELAAVAERRAGESALRPVVVLM